MAAASELRLAAGALAVDLVPGIGGSVAALRWQGADVLRPLSPADRSAGNVLGVAIFPMLPVANRIAGNAFRFEGKTHGVAGNNPPERFHVHGTGWHLPWTVAAASATAARLTLAHAGRPWSYRATQDFTLSGDGLGMRLAIENTGDTRMPFGLGWHPWFPRDPGTRLRFRATRFYLEEPEGVSGDPVGLPAELDFAAGAPLPAGWRNNCYGGWDGEATITLTSRGLALHMTATPGLGHLQFYADPAKTFFCLEPQSMASGALNRSGGLADPAQGAILLGPGERAEVGLRLTVTAENT